MRKIGKKVECYSDCSSMLCPQRRLSWPYLKPQTGAEASSSAVGLQSFCNLYEALIWVQVELFVLLLVDSL